MNAKKVGSNKIVNQYKEKLPRTLTGVSGSKYQVIGIVEKMVLAFYVKFGSAFGGGISAHLHVHLQNFNVKKDKDRGRSNHISDTQAHDKFVALVAEWLPHFKFSHKDRYSSVPFTGAIQLKGKPETWLKQLESTNPKVNVINEITRVLYLDEDPDALLHMARTDIEKHVKSELVKFLKTVGPDESNGKGTKHNAATVCKTLGLPEHPEK